MADPRDDELPDFAEDTIEQLSPLESNNDGKAQKNALPQPTPRSGELQENQMIVENYRRDPLPLWTWLILLVFLAALLWGIGSWFRGEQTRLIEGNPFQQVTNRQLTSFLWQFPEYMRVNSPIKEGYLPAFEYQNGKVSLIPASADQYAIAPPEVLFLYHTWHRLLSENQPLPPVSYADLEQFLNSEPAWQPAYWEQAPDSYKKLISGLPQIKSNQRQQLVSLPKEVHQAIVGWKSFTIEGPAVDAVKPTFAEMDSFLMKYPHYKRNYWRNIVMEKRPNYLKTLASGNFEAKARVPDDELTGFLKMAFYNAKKLETK